MMADYPRPTLTLEELTREIKALVWRSWQDYYTLGHRLKLVKGMLTHGAWLAWLEETVPFSVTTAERCMRADDLVQEYPALREGTVAVETSAIDLLTARRTPTAVVRRLVRDAAKGRPITQDRVQAELGKVRSPRQPKLSSRENLPHQPAPVADLDDVDTPLEEASAPVAPTPKFFDDVPMEDFEWPPTAVTYDLGQYDEAGVWLVYTAIQGFLDYEDEAQEAGAVAPLYDEGQRTALREHLVALRTRLEAQGFPFDAEEDTSDATTT